MALSRITLAIGLVLSLTTTAPAKSDKATPPAKPLSKKALKKLVEEATRCPVLHGSRCPALDTIVKHRASAGPALMSYLRSKKAARRALAATALGMIGYGPASKKVMALLDDRDVSVQHAAIIATGRLGGTDAVPSLSRVAGRADLNRRVLAATALGLTGKSAAVTTLLRLLGDPHPKVKANAARALGAIGNKRATLPLGAILADPVSRAPVRQATAEALGRLGDPDGVAILLQATGETDPHVRKAAVVALGDLKDPRAVSALSLLVKDPELTEAAMRAMGQIGHVGALPSLLRITKEPGTDSITLKQAFWAIGEIKSESTVAALKPYLAAKDKHLVRWSCDALGRIRLQSATQPLIDTLHHEDNDVREMSAWALQRITGVNLGTDVARWEEWFYARQPPE